jgi:hypothetical protein
MYYFIIITGGAAGKGAQDNMKNNFHERRQNRIAYAQEKAAKKQQQSEKLYENAQQMASFIPFGQPILVGHHSEGRDRRFRKKIRNTFDKSFQAQETANYYSDKAETIENNRAIFSDDPEALDKLREKLAGIEAAQVYMKAANKYIRKGDKAGFLTLPHATEERWQELTTPSRMNRIGFPSYAFQNNNAEIRRVKQRIAYLESLTSRETAEKVINGVRLIENVEANRVQLFFDDIPSEEVRKKLKSNGFRWSPSVGAWQRHLNLGAARTARGLLEGL